MKEYKKMAELDILPVKPQKEIDDLRDDLRKGYDPQNAIVVWKGKDVIVDGNHRYDICREEGIEPVFIEEKFDSITAAKIYIWKHYLQPGGRAKTETQKASGILELKELIDEVSQAAKERQKVTHGQDPITGKFTPVSAESPSLDNSGKTTEKLAEIIGTSGKTVARVMRVQKQGVPELKNMMLKGNLSADAAEEFVKNTPIEEQKEIVKSGGAKAVKKTVSEIRKIKKGAKEFDRFNDPLKKKNEKDIADYRKLKELSGGACLLPNLKEMYCNTCKWGFDIYLPPPNEAKCPYCCGTDVCDREIGWNSRLAIYNE